MGARRPSDLLQSVSRALRVLEEVGRHPGGVNAKRVARHCGLNLATTYHLLRTLSYEQYLLRLPSGDYVLGPAVADRFLDLVSALSQPREVLDVLRRAASRTAHSFYAARFVEGRVTIAHVAEGPDSPHVEDLVVGFDDGAHATALGKALLATLPCRGQLAYLREQGMRRYTPETVQDPDGLLAELRASAPTGVFTEQGQYRPGVACAAVLVRCGGDGGGWLALGASTARTRFADVRRRLVRELSAAAAELTDAFGG